MRPPRNTQRPPPTVRPLVLLMVAILPGWRHHAAPATQDPPPSGYFKVGPDSLFYETEGEGRAVIFLHDGTVHGEIWENQVPVFSRGFRVVSYDRRGFGRSPTPTEPFSDLEDLEALFNQLGIETAILVGMSSGGRLAIDFTLRNPEQVTALVLVGAVAQGFSYTDHFFTRGGHLPPNLPASEIRAWLASEDPYLVHSGNPGARARVRELVDRYPRDLGPDVPRSARAPSAMGRLGRISIPTLILVGEFDIPDVHAHAGAISAGIPDSRRDIIAGAGHLPPMEQPELFNRAVREFLGQALRPSREGGR